MIQYDELKRLAEAIHGQGSTMQMLARWREFEHACEPKIILALIAENERLKADNDRLEDRSFEMNKSWAEERKVTIELRTEIAGLKTGYEAYERVNAELKAECEVMRKDAERLDWIAENFTGHGNGIEFNLRLHLPCDIEDGGLIHAIDAAMGQGERS